MLSLIKKLINPFFLIKKIYSRLFHLYKLHIVKDEFTMEVTRWFEDKGDETLRLNYPELTQDSVVFDLGGYVGDFAFEINQKYGSKVYLFEPHPKFFEICDKRFSNNTNIIPLNYGLSDIDGIFHLSDSVDGSSFLNPNHKGKKLLNCKLRDFFKVLEDLKISKIDLMKINIEGGEYPLLQYISDKNKLEIVDQYQIQFHNFIDEAESKRNSIIKSLGDSHHQTWCYKFVWENWQLSEKSN